MVGGRVMRLGLIVHDAAFHYSSYSTRLMADGEMGVAPFEDVKGPMNPHGRRRT